MTETNKTWLRLPALITPYERSARLVPALTSLLPLLPLTFALGGSLDAWGAVLGGTSGIFAIGGFALAHLASALGNRLQKGLWPSWPFDAPTNVRLMPSNPDTSPQQRRMWYRHIKRITGLDLVAESKRGDEAAMRATVNDAVERVRNHFRRTQSRARHDQESVRYGSARNLAGMRPVWLGLSCFSAVGCWVAYFWLGTGVLWPVVATTLTVPLFLVAFFVLPDYVRTRARYYCEVFFRLLEEDAST